MKIKSKGNGVRYDGPAEKIEAARKSGAGFGVFLPYKKWCAKCGADRPALGAKQIRPGMWRCAKCVGVADAREAA